jgi:hypothetical protein
MFQKENKFTGFIGHYDNKTIVEKENFYSKKLNKRCATNWAEIDKNKLIALELLWQGKSIIKIDKENYPHIKPEDWFFTQTGIYNIKDKKIKDKKIKVLARNIGYKKDNITQVYSVEEETGILRSSVRG